MILQKNGGQVGKTISHYKILEKLGEGGMGVVYKAEDTKLDRLVALKFLPAHLIDDEQALSRLLKEAKAASKINHPNVCTIHTIEEYEDTQYIVMEYVDGETLREKIQEIVKAEGEHRGSPLRVDETVEYSEQICKALKAAHDKGITHRDIKSENIMINTDNMVKVMDFGLAKLKDEARLSRTSSTAGTIAYMAPEQIKGDDIDHRADIWALGVVLFEMLTGKFPFKGEYESAMPYSIVNTDPEPIKIFRSEVPEELELIIYKALEKSTDERYQSADDVLDDVKKFSKELESKISKEKAAAEKPKPSIAVLPFRNMSADPEQEYFCEGMTEEIINALTHIENLKVIARTSAFAFKDKHEDVREIGKKLDVENLLEGSIRKAGNQLRITAQLVKVSDGSHLWSEKYDREMKNIFNIQDEISLAIVDNLKVKLLGKEKAAIVKRYTEDLEAYNLYLKGNYYWQMFTMEGIDKAIECYEQALQKDKNYALAYTGLAMVYMISSYFGNVPPNEAYPKAKEYVKKAFEIDDTLAEAHASLGFINTSYDWNWKAAEREFKQALQLNPNSADIHLWYSMLLTVTERHEEAIFEAKRAQELDPLSSLINSMLGNSFFFGSQYDEAIEVLRMTIMMNPNYFHSNHILGLAYRGKSMFEEAIEELEKAVELSGENPNFIAELATAYYEFGEKEKTEKLFDSLLQRSRDEYVPPTCFYWIHRVRGDMDQAFEWLERACNEHDSWLPWFRVYQIDKYRIPDEPRFKALLKKAGLE